MNIKTIIEKAADDIISLSVEAEKDILEAIEKSAMEAATQEKPPKFTLSFTVALDLQNNTQENKLAWNVRHSLSSKSDIEDENQPKLPLGSTVEITTGDRTTGPIPVEKFSRAVKKLKGKL